MKRFENILKQFDKVTLSDLDKVKLMNRTDLKFCMHINELPSILETLKSHYQVLQIDDKIIFNYDNTYFDTIDNRMFLSHHNGKKNRFKIRVRNYVESNLNFLEIKFKTNKGRTIKERVIKRDFVPEFTEIENSFLEKTCPFEGSMLEPKINSFFKRFTMVNNEFTERVTVDVYPGFKNTEKEIVLNNLVIIEIKQSKSCDIAFITKLLRDMKICRNGFSKYCVGRSLLEDDIKKNNFKPLIMKLKKYYLN
jgi:hypothetical protein